VENKKQSFKPTSTTIIHYTTMAPALLEPTAMNRQHIQLLFDSTETCVAGFLHSTLAHRNNPHNC